MGNPEILHNDTLEPQVQPTKMTGLWQVYLLRKDGVKLPPDMVLRTGVRGILTFDSFDTQRAGLRPSLFLMDKSGTPCRAHMSDARLVRMTLRGMLFRGTTMHSNAKLANLNVPQAWWCMLAGAINISQLPSDFE